MEKSPRREREKKIRENEIINAAMKLFIEKGYENSSMDEIAREAQFTKRTLYQYFENKEDLYFAVALKLFTEMFSYTKLAIEKGKTGFEKIKLSCYAQYQFYKDFPEASKLMTYIGFIKKINEDSPKRREWLNFDDAMFKGFSKIIEDGKIDGSINNKLDAEKTTYSLVFLTTGFFHLLSETGKTFTTHFDLNMDNFVNYSIDLLLNSIKNEDL